MCWKFNPLDHKIEVGLKDVLYLGCNIEVFIVVSIGDECHNDPPLRLFEIKNICFPLLWDCGLVSSNLSSRPLRVLPHPSETSPPSVLVIPTQWVFCLEVDLSLKTLIYNTDYPVLWLFPLNVTSQGLSLRHPLSLSGIFQLQHDKSLSLMIMSYLFFPPSNIILSRLCSI